MQERWPVAALTGEPAPVTAAGVRRTSAGGRARIAIAVVTATTVVLADQLSKWWAVRRLAHGPIHVLGRLDLELSFNTGSAFSAFRGQTGLIVALALALVAVLLVMVWRAPTAGRAVVLGLILGGALGNLADRFFRSDHGAVVDFIALHFWPTFNLADSCIVVGCILLVVSLIRGPARS